jgi:hypothetical protein
MTTNVLDVPGNENMRVLMISDGYQAVLLIVSMS